MIYILAWYLIGLITSVIIIYKGDEGVSIGRIFLCFLTAIMGPILTIFFILIWIAELMSKKD
jgi:hypothetical protein